MKVRDKIDRCARDIAEAQGWKVDPSVAFGDKAIHPRARDAWMLAMVAWESIHGDTPDLDADIECDGCNGAGCADCPSEPA